MNYYTRFMAWITLQRVTKVYLWWVVVRFFLRWILTFAFIYWIWFLGSPEKKIEFQQKMKFKVNPPQVQWTTHPMELYFPSNITKRVIFGLREDGVIVYKTSKEQYENTYYSN